MSNSCQQSGLLVYVQIISILMPIFFIGIGAAVVYMVAKLGASGMCRRAWKANVRAILDELDKEHKQIRPTVNDTPNENLEIVAGNEILGHGNKNDPVIQSAVFQPTPGVIPPTALGYQSA
ncbi:hypothetical protein M3Y94_01236900 [Aphelenchoides besseyi]|nr:hypothetical protein M3Y94_01236900 [Aphelenchoides besseyi]KAI6217517.1 hypothetical protein M3Y95_01212100 [Aphelenchoides besseyi]